MLTLRTSEEFAQWFAALDRTTAEDVASTLEVIVQLGPERDAPGSSEWLTWYEHASVSQGLGGLALYEHPLASLNPVVARFVREWGEFSGYARRAIKHLESPAFVARLEHLDDGGVAAVASAVARIRRATTRRLLAISDSYRKLRQWAMRPLTPREESALLALADVQEVRDAYLGALAAAGFDVVDMPAASPALREITLRTPPPGIRLLYGIDPAKGRGLVVLGERFDRSFYGHSVRIAEQRWREFLLAEAEQRPSP